MGSPLSWGRGTGRGLGEGRYSLKPRIAAAPPGICRPGCRLPHPLAAPHPCCLAGTAFQVFVHPLSDLSVCCACFALSPSIQDV